MTTRRPIGLFAIFALVLAACSGGTSEGSPQAAAGAAATEGDDSAKPTGISDAALAAELAKPSPTLTSAQGKKFVNDTLFPVLTTNRLKLLNDFILAGEGTPSDEYQTLAADMEAIFWGTPRDLVASPAGYGGQKFETTVVIDDSAGPTKLKVIGTASSAYTLTFSIAATTKLTAKIPAHATPAQTAKLIAAAINGSLKTITDHVSDFRAIGGDHADAQSGIDDIEVSLPAEDTVQILVALNG